MSEWKCYKLNEISSLSNGINFDKSAYTSGVKLIGVSDFKNRIHPDYDSLQEVDSKVVSNGDYLEKGEDSLINQKKPGNPLCKYSSKKNLSEMEKLQYENMKLRIENERLKKGYLVKGDGSVVVFKK